MPAMQSGDGGRQRRCLRALINAEQREIDGGRYEGHQRKEKWAKDWLTDLRIELKKLNAEILKERKSRVSTAPKTA